MLKYIHCIIYLLGQITNVISTKSISYYYSIDNIIFSCLIYGFPFPLLFGYFIYKKQNIEIINILVGLLDFIIILLIYIGIHNLKIAEYLSYRTFSIIFNVILSYFF